MAVDPPVSGDSTMSMSMPSSLMLTQQLQIIGLITKIAIFSPRRIATCILWLRRPRIHGYALHFNDIGLGRHHKHWKNHCLFRESDTRLSYLYRYYHGLFNRSTMVPGGRKDASTNERTRT